MSRAHPRGQGAEVRRRTGRGLVWELLLIGLVGGGLYLLLVSAVGADLAGIFGEMMARPMVGPTPSP